MTEFADAAFEFDVRTIARHEKSSPIYFEDPSLNPTNMAFHIVTVVVALTATVRQ